MRYYYYTYRIPRHFQNNGEIQHEYTNIHPLIAAARDSKRYDDGPYIVEFFSEIDKDIYDACRKIEDGEQEEEEDEPS